MRFATRDAQGSLKTGRVPGNTQTAQAFLQVVKRLEQQAEIDSSNNPGKAEIEEGPLLLVI